MKVSPLERAGPNPLAVLNWQPKRADAVYSQVEWTALCEHLHNDNGTTHFVMGFRNKDGCKKYVRSKKLPVGRAISWSWGSIAGSPKSRLAFVPYSVNIQQQSHWGGMDFDAHQPGQADRARELALAAFRVLLNTSGLAVILETSGSGGWHVWAISPDFQPACEWVRLLKSVVAAIGTVIASGVCEIFPPDSLPSRFGKGMRAPGCWNPSTDKFNEIVWENCRTSLETVLSRKSKFAPLNCKGLETRFPETKKKGSFSPSFISNPTQLDLLHKFGIKDSNTRNDQLSALTGAAFHQLGFTVARHTAQAQFQRKSVPTEADEQAHMASFDDLWSGLAENWIASLSAAERQLFTRLETANERDAFRIVRSFARKAEQDGAADFPIARDNLASRLGITGKGAAGIRDKLVRLGAISKTKDYIPNKFAARFRWLLPKSFK
jgi:hypothetical protein